jgi:hypothetical protein
MKKFIITITPALWSICLWTGHFYLEGHPKKHYLVWLFASYVLLVPGYFLIRVLKKPVIGFRWGMLLFGMLTVFTPSFLQTDQLRYVWDGIQVSKGLNPYRLSPKAAMEHFPAVPFWATQINHPEMTTVYPPAAQVIFGLSTFTNPFLYEHSSKRLSMWSEKVPQSLYWPWELGLRIVLGIATTILIFLLKSRRWDLVVFHPLFLLTSVANIHIDALLLAPLVVVLGSWSLLSSSKNGLTLAFASLMRWTPLLFLPHLGIRQIKLKGTQFYLLSIFVTLSCIFLALGFFNAGSGGHLFTSSKIYAEHWSFFGYLHRFLRDFIEYFELSKNPTFAAKFILTTLYLFWVCALSLLQWNRKLGFRLACTLNYLGFLAVLPTLHPWYLLPLILIGLPFINQLKTVWLWPLLAPLSYTYYFEMQDPVAVRISVYLTVSVILLADLCKLSQLPTIGRRKLRNEINHSAVSNLQ